MAQAKKRARVSRALQAASKSTGVFQSKERSAAVLTIKDADQMTKRGRRDIADWLRKQADFLIEHGDQFSGRFRARYLYRE